MKTNIINIHGMYVVKTRRVFVYVDEYENYSYSDEIIDVCTGKHYGFDEVAQSIHLVGNPDDMFIEESKKPKRGKRSNSNNKNRHRCVRKIDDELPF